MARVGELTISQRALILIALPTTAALVFLSSVGFMLYQSQEQAKRETRSNKILFEVQTIGLAINESIRTMPVDAFRGRAEKRYRALSKARERHFQRLDKLMRPFGDLLEKERRWGATTQRLFDLIEAIDEYTEVSETRASLIHHKGILRQLGAVFAYEAFCRRNLVLDLEKVQRESRVNIAYWNQLVSKMVALALPINAALCLGLVVYYSKSINRRLAALIDNSNRLAAGEVLLPVQRGHDEIGSLDRVLHRMAQDLEDTMKQEKAILDKAADVICTVTDELIFELVNSSALRAWGYTPAELSGAKLSSIIHADDIDFVEDEMREISGGKSEGGFECRLRQKDGAVIHSSFSISWLDDTREYYLVAHDITERKLEEALIAEREQFVRLVIESMPLGLLVLDDRGIIERSNRSLKQMLSFEEADLSQKPIQAIFDENAIEPVSQFMTGTVAGGVYQADMRTRDGGTLPAEITLSEFWWKDERRVLVIVQDITIRLEVERLKREFIAMVSHDLRSPLSTLMMSMELLQNEKFGTLNQDGKEQAVLAEEEMERLIVLVSTLLDIEKFQDGQMEIQRQPVDVGKIIQHTADAVSPYAMANGITIDTDVISLEAKIDEGGITQLLINLISNAIKFSPPASNIKITLQQLDGWLDVHVIDEGRGIPDTHKVSIFERFKQVEITDRTVKKGSGLGLAISKLIVEAHGGSIGVTSKPGNGSDFWFRIPLGL